jgi:thiol-disulfide isomerase/thioredoxin
MKVLHINSNDGVENIDKAVKQGKDVFILVFMEGCGPCNAVRPEWAKLESALKQQYHNNDKLVVIDVNKDLLPHIKSIGSIDGFPTIKYISNRGNTIENYEDSNITKKDRSIDSFINWIESKILDDKIVSTTPASSPIEVYKRISNTYSASARKKSKSKSHSQTSSSRRKSKTQKGGKWSRKYKMSINCRTPKGFSQKQYCKYGRKK